MSCPTVQLFTCSTDTVLVLCKQHILHLSAPAGLAAHQRATCKHITRALLDGQPFAFESCCASEAQ